MMETKATVVVAPELECDLNLVNRDVRKQRVIPTSKSKLQQILRSLLRHLLPYLLCHRHLRHLLRHRHPRRPLELRKENAI
jgi:hypothetical protein